MTTWVVLPTYNERDNLKPMVEALLALSLDLHILIVDDNSPDGTGHIADDLVHNHPHSVEVLHRSAKEGLGRAYLAGFQTVLARGADFIIQMDTDFSHPVRFVPLLFEQAKSCDLAIGSRYISGGGSSGWSLPRRVLSQFGNGYARFLLKIPVSDTTGGFKCWRRKALEAIDLKEIRSNGYVFQIEMTYLAWKRGFTVKEVPILFEERATGHSKMSRKIVLEAIVGVWKMRRHSKT